MKFWILVIIACGVFLWLIKAPVMSSYFTKKMNISVSVGTISMWPSVTSMHRFKILNPHGFQSHTAFQVSKTKVYYRLGHLFHTPTEIDEITLDGVYLNIEVRNATGSDNNWAAIGAHMPKKGKGKEVIIHKLILRDMTVETLGKGATLLGVAGTQHFDRMEFNEIDSREGFPTKELISQIFQRAGLQKYLQYFLNPVDTIKNINPFNLFGKKSPQLEAVKK